jgi:hypothetical protein
MERRHQLGLNSYDRFFPSQDTMPKGGFGNLIAPPFEQCRGKAATVFSSIQTFSLMQTPASKPVARRLLYKTFYCTPGCQAPCLFKFRSQSARNTLHQEMVILRQTLKTAVRHAWLERLPHLCEPYRSSPKISHRAWFSPEAYKQLYEATRKRSHEPKQER